MDKIQSQVKEFCLKALQECPDSPSIPNFSSRVLRTRLIAEEFLEFAKASGISIFVDERPISMIDLHFCDSGEDPDIVEVADAIGDLNYVSYGAALCYGLDMEPLEKAIHENNMTKFIDGYVDTNGKLRKGPSYKPVDLTELIKAQKK